MKDPDFCNVLYAYAWNHREEKGLLKEKMYRKINDVIFEEMSFRIYNLDEKDLGLAMRAMAKLDLSLQEGKWG